MTPAEDAQRWRVAAAVLVAGVAACAGWVFASVPGGYFLSDDFVPLVLFRHWQDSGTLQSHLLEKFHTGLDAGENHFYRPLSYLTFALHYVTSGIDPAPWMQACLGLHAANAALVAALGASLAADRTGARELAAGVAGAALFLFFAPGAEVAVWISGRFDATATFFTLAACLAFVRSRRAFDASWWISLASAEAAFLCKESAAIVPFAIVLIARTKPASLDAQAPLARWTAAIRAASPWLAIAALYLVSRYVFFGSFTRVYGGSQPTEALVSGEYWRGVADTLRPWLEAQFHPAYRIPAFAALAASQVVIFAFARPQERRAREALIACAGIVAITLLLLAPHVGKLPADGLGGRLLYQSSAFYGVFAVVGLCHARVRYIAWGATLALVVLNAAFMNRTVVRWSTAYEQMRALVDEVVSLSTELPPGEFALAIVPASMNDVPFARNAQGGLMLPPVMRQPISSRVLVQIDEEVPSIAGKIADNVVTTLRARPVMDYLAGVRVTAPAPEYPTRIVCWDPTPRKFVRVNLEPAPTPEEWGQSLQRALRYSPCTDRTMSRR